MHHDDSGAAARASPGSAPGRRTGRRAYSLEVPGPSEARSDAGARLGACRPAQVKSFKLDSNLTALPVATELENLTRPAGGPPHRDDGTY